MNFIKKHYYSIILYNFITKFNYTNIFEIPQFTKIVLNIGLKNSFSEKKKIINILLLLELITNKPALITKSKKNKITLKIKKGMFVGCKTTLRKNSLYIFLDKLILFIFPTINNFEGISLKKENIINFRIRNILNFIEIEEEFLKFQNNYNIDVSLHSNCKSSEEFSFLLNCINFPFRK